MLGACLSHIRGSDIRTRLLLVEMIPRYMQLLFFGRARVWAENITPKVCKPIGPIGHEAGFRCVMKVGQHSGFAWFVSESNKPMEQTAAEKKILYRFLHCCCTSYFEVRSKPLADIRQSRDASTITPPHKNKTSHRKKIQNLL